MIFILKLHLIMFYELVVHSKSRSSSQRKTQTLYFSSGCTTTIEFDKSPAFVTFMIHPIPYVGTGIQGHLANNYMKKTSPPN
jgi:hypothetical protein